MEVGRHNAVRVSKPSQAVHVFFNSCLLSQFLSLSVSDLYSEDMDTMGAVWVQQGRLNSLQSSMVSHVWATASNRRICHNHPTSSVSVSATLPGAHGAQSEAGRVWFLNFLGGVRMTGAETCLQSVLSPLNPTCTCRQPQPVYTRIAETRGSAACQCLFS